MAKKRNQKKRRRYQKRNRFYVLVMELLLILGLILVIATIVGKNASSSKKHNTSEIDTAQEMQVDQQEAETIKDEEAIKEEQAIKEEEKNEETSVETEEKDDALSVEEEKKEEQVPVTEENQIETEQVETLPQIPIEGLSTEVLGWGQGVNFDEQNRPVGSLSYQEKYGKYQAYFIAQPDSVIYLTFDEGYEYGCTPEILDVLKEKGVKAVFFITLPYAKQNPELVQRIIDEGHQLGNHSVTHPSQGLPSQTIEEQREEVQGCHDYVKENFGYEMHLFRYPTGKFSEQSLAIVNNCNYKSVFWSFAYLDYDVNNQPDEAESLQKLVDRLHPGAIYLLHAESVTNTHILGRLIDQGRDLGYSFEMFQ